MTFYNIFEAETEAEHMSVTKNIRFCLLKFLSGERLFLNFTLPHFFLLAAVKLVLESIQIIYKNISPSPLFSICILAFNSISCLRCKSRTSVAVKSALDSIQIICNDISPPLWTFSHFFLFEFCHSILS